MKIDNDNLYKYQIETFQELDKIPGKLETRTNEKYLILIGEYTHEYFNGSAYVTHTGNLYLGINYGDNFILIDDLVEEKESISLYHVFNWNLKIKLNKNVFKNINKTIDKILRDNQSREKYYNKLNNQLQAINNSLF